MYIRANDIANPADNTYEWIVKHPSYLEWLQTRSGLLWIKGKPGAGKSTLLKYALQQEGYQQEGHEQTVMSIPAWRETHRDENPPIFFNTTKPTTS